jgi:murein L,D-transpeptidase YafK
VRDEFYIETSGNTWSFLFFHILLFLLIFSTIIKYFYTARRLLLKGKIVHQMKFNRFFQISILISVLALVSFIPVKKKRTVTKKAKQAVKAVSRDSLYNPYYIIVDKSDYELYVYDDEGWYATYPIVFGSKDLRDKMREGDKRTPEGNFKVILKKIHHKWGPELLLDYPNDITFQKFNDRKAKGLVPKNAKIGNGIAIHATRPAEEWTIDNFYNWTDGCVSVKYTEMKDLYNYIPVGTPVTIRQ